MAAKKKTTKKAVKKKAQKSKAKAKTAPARRTAKKRPAKPKAATETPGPAAPGPRYRRPEPERTQPLRSGAGGGFNPTHGHAEGYAPHTHPFQRASEALANDLGSTVGKAVDLGYRVIEDQIRQGRDVAAQLGHGHYDGTPWQGQSSGLRGVTVTTMLASLWFDLLGNLVNGIQEMGVDAMGGGFSLESGPSMPWQPAGGDRRPSAPGSGSVCSVAVEVDSRRPVEVEIDLGRIRAEQRVAAHLVNAGDPDAPALTDVLFDIVETEEGNPRPRVRVRVDDDLSSGLYTGVAIDCDSGRHIGSLTIRVNG